jgi:hypothetical protein
MLQVALVFVAPLTNAVNVALVPAVTVAAPGEIVTLIEGALTTVTVADELWVPATASIVTGLASAVDGAE